MNRRNFIGQASCAAIGSTSFINSLLNLNLMNAAAGYGNTGDYKALVCILLAGGNDSFNMLIPKGDAEYNEYAAVRSGLAIPKDQILNLVGGTSNGKTLGVHPSMSGVRDLYNSGKLSFLSNVGTLVEPTTQTQYNNNTVTVPKGLFSHSDQIAQWQTSVPQSISQIGWGGRMADLLSSLNSNMTVSMNISLSGVNVFQLGNSVFPFAVTAAGSQGINGYGGGGLFNIVKTNAIDSLLDLSYLNLFEKTYSNNVRNAIDSNEQFQAALTGVSLTSPFTQTNPLAKDLEMIAKIIKARDTLGFSRQTFFVTFGGWDHHDEVLNNQLLMLGIVSQALQEFSNAMTELNTENEVTTFTISDFGRTLSSNGNGSDHAWGGNHMIMGGAVNGGNIFGSFPDLYVGNSQDLGRGRLLPTSSADEYFADLALWFGVSPSDLDMVLPNIFNFIAPGTSTGPLGIMS